MKESLRKFGRRVKQQDIRKTLRQALRVGGEMSTILVQLKAKPGPLLAASLAMKAYDLCAEHMSMEREKLLPDWLVDPYCYRFRAEVFDRLLEQPGRVIITDSTADGSMSVYTVLEDGVEICFTKRESDPVESVNGPLIKELAHAPVAWKLFGRTIWEVYGNSLELSFDGHHLKIQIDPMDGALQSATADQAYERMRRFTDAGYKRATLFYGPPGTGKSHMIRYISRLAGGFSVRLTGESIYRATSSDLKSLLVVLQPSAVLIDDLDRFSESERVLTEIELLRENTKYLMATVNRVSELDPAMVRPGRFDDVIEIKTLDGKIMDDLIGPGVPDEVAEKLRRIPIAYIDEFHRRRKVLGMVEAIAEIEELLTRAGLAPEGEWEMGSSRQSQQRALLNIQSFLDKIT